MRILKVIKMKGASMKRGSLLIFIVGIACFSVLLLSKIIRIDYGILAMNLENVTESTYPLFVKYNGEWEYNIYMLPDGKKYNKSI